MYMAAYWLSVRPMVSLGTFYAGPTELRPHYECFGRSLDGTFVPKFFYPLHRLDVAVRKKHWVVNSFEK